MKFTERSIVYLYKYSRTSRCDIAKHCKQMRRIKTSQSLLKKYGARLGRRLKQVLLKNSIDVIVPVPLHIAVEKERGFNQAVIIAEQIGKLLNVPVCGEAVKKVKKTCEIKHLPISVRKKEVENSFRVKRKKEVLGRNILIVDDVIASGATIDLLRNELMNAGAKQVSAAALYLIIR